MEATGVVFGAGGRARPYLVLEAGARRFPIVSLHAEGCLIEAGANAVRGGFADIYDGDRHLERCLIVLAAPEGDYLHCAFKRRTSVRIEPPRDFAPGGA